MEKTDNKKKIAIIAVAVVAVVVIVLAVVFLGRTNKFDTVVTAENFESIEKEFANPNSDEAYYYAYACMYYIMTDGLANMEDENAMYQRVYGKTIQTLIDEGKDLMKENDISLDDFKKQVDELDNM